MAVLAFVRPDPGFITEPADRPVREALGRAERRLRLYGRAMRLCFICALAVWVILQVGCLLSLYMHFQSGIVAGTIDGTLAFKFRPPFDGFSFDRVSSGAFIPHVFSLRTAVGYTIVLIVASAPFCVALLYLAKLFDLYSQLQIFTPLNSTVLRRIGHSIMATGWSPLLLGPIAHAIGVLKPISGLTGGMIAFVFVGVVLLAISHVMEIGQRMRQEQEEIL